MILSSPAVALAPKNLSKTPTTLGSDSTESGIYFVHLFKLGFEVGAPSIEKPTFNVTWKWLTLPSLMCPLVRATSNHPKCLIV